MRFFLLFYSWRIYLKACFPFYKIQNISADSDALFLSPQTPPFYVRVLQAAPGFETAIAVKIKKISRLRAPYKSMCVSEYPPAFVPFTVRER